MNQQSFSQYGDQLIRGGAIFLGAISIMLCTSMIMAVFTPFPLSLVHVLYGRKKGLLVGAIGSVFIFFLGWKVLYGPVIFWMYILSLIFSFVIAEIVLRKRDPLKGFLSYGWTIFVVLAGLVGARLLTMEGSFKDYLLKNTEVLSSQIKKDEAKLIELKGEEGQELLEILSKPEAMVSEIIDYLPKAFFISVFFFLWSNLLLLLKARHFYRFKLGYPFTEKHLLKFKVPEYMIWPVIMCLLVVALGEYKWVELNPAVPAVSKNLLYGFGLFYFFHGFGLYIDFLDSLKIYGFFRSLLVIFTVVSGYWILIMAGLFDMWVNFRKFFKKKES